MAWLAEGRSRDGLDAGPLPLLSDRLEYVNGVETEGELAALRQSVRRGGAIRDGGKA